MDDEISQRNITVNLSHLKEDIDSEQVENVNWTSESNHDFNAALGDTN